MAFIRSHSTKTLQTDIIPFCTRETATQGIDSYLEFRRRCGEKLEFNDEFGQWEPLNAPLFRRRFNESDSLQAQRPKFMDLSSIRGSLTRHLTKCGIRNMEHTEHEDRRKRVRKDTPLTNGFRKRVISIFIGSQLNHEIRELIVDHDTRLDSNYFRPSQEQVLSEYLKAEPNLTIDQTYRLQQEVQTLRLDKTKMEQMLDRINALENKILNDE